MIKAEREKESGEKYAIGFRYRAPDLQSGESITGATVTVSPSGLTLVGSPVIDGDEVRQVIEGGVDGDDYVLEFEVDTSASFTYIDHYLIRVRDH